MIREKVLEAIIAGYRNTIQQRYQYENIKDNYQLPESIDAETVNQLREYFLKYMYPEFSKRQELNSAFNSLEEFTKHPKKLVGIALDATKLIFKYGRHLPKILNTGLKAMQSFKAADNFENNLVDEAIKNKIDGPYNPEKIDALIKLLSREEIEKFIHISESLFEVLHDKVLINKIKGIIAYLIQKMRKKENIYTPSQIKGLEIGLEMLTEGDALFNRLSLADQQNLIDLIIEVEKDALARIF
ncbi:hypothetical protein [Lacinutrix sp. MEBiC02595]